MNKRLVIKGYNKIAKRYSLSRNQFKNLKYLEKLNSLLKPNSRILDLGCGAGKPIDEFFINHGHKIIGIDISSEQVKLAKKNIPAGSFKIKDIASLKENEFEVEAVVSFYTIFHLPRKKHQKLFKIINSFLRAGGLLLITMGTSDWEGTGDFYKTQMYWSHYGPEKNRKIIEEAGFEIIFDKIDTSGGEKHQITLARKITTPT